MTGVDGRFGLVQLGANEPHLARTQLIETVLQSAVRHVAALSRRQLALAHGLAVTTGAAKSRLTVRTSVASRT